MTTMAVAHRRDTAQALPTLALWVGAAVFVCVVHAGMLWYAMTWVRTEVAGGEAPPAIMIELAPLAVAPEAAPQEVAPGPPVTEAEPDPPPPDQQAEHIPVEDTPPPPPAPEPEIRVPEAPVVPQAAAVVPPPPPPRREVERPRPPRPPQRVERPRPPRPERPRVRQTTAPPAAQAQRADTAAAAAAGAAASAAAQASWRGALMAHLNRHKRFPPGASQGVAQVAFTIDRAGRVLSSRLVRGSGDSALDNEAVAMMRRASPVPAPPQGVGGGGSITLAVPVRFNR